MNATGTFSRLGFFGEDIQNESEKNIRFMRIELIKEATDVQRADNSLLL